jgi:hypothetical protein
MCDNPANGQTASIQATAASAETVSAIGSSTMFGLSS